MKVELSTVPQLGTVPPLAGRGGTSEPGRAFSLRSDWAESSRGVGPPAAKKENPPFFSLLRTRWNVMVWFQTSQGGGYPRGKNRRKWDKDGSGVKTQPRRASGRVWLWMNLSSASVSPVAPHELKPGKLWIYPGVIPLTGQQTSGGKVWISVFAPVLTFVWGDQGNKRARSAASWVGPSRDCRSLNCGKFFNPPPPFACSSPPPLLV